MIRHLSRSYINSETWNRCISSSPNRIIYGYSWYLDAVTNLPNWCWEGLVFTDSSGDWLAVMPVPLRRKFGIWVVHQPLFCQFLGVFGASVTTDIVDAFAGALLKRYRYGSIFYLHLPTQAGSFQTIPFTTSDCRTHLLDLSVGYRTIYQNYSSDTRRHLRQAQAANWLLQESTDSAPLLSLFRQYHARQIPGGVGDWAYPLFENLYSELQKRGMASIRYAVLGGQIEAGAVFIECDGRIIYLFNAASETGRRHHARTLLIDKLIQELAGRNGLMVDFESPEKESIAQFYRGFGAIESPFWAVRWTNFPWLFDQLLPKLRRLLQPVEPLDVHI